MGLHTRRSLFIAGNATLAKPFKVQKEGGSREKKTKESVTFSCSASTSFPSSALPSPCLSDEADGGGSSNSSCCFSGNLEVEGLFERMCSLSFLCGFSLPDLLPILFPLPISSQKNKNEYGCISN